MLVNVDLNVVALSVLIQFNEKWNSIRRRSFLTIFKVCLSFFVSRLYSRIEKYTGEGAYLDQYYVYTHTCIIFKWKKINLKIMYFSYDLVWFRRLFERFFLMTEIATDLAVNYHKLIKILTNYCALCAIKTTRANVFFANKIIDGMSDQIT